MKQAILWDNDGVLVRTEDLYFLATRRVMRDLGADLDRDTYHRLFMHESVDPLEALLTDRGLGRDAFLTHHRERIRHHMHALQHADVHVEGVSETLHALSDDYVMGVVTGARRNQVEALMERTDFFHLFSFVVTYDDVSRTKPDPEPYLKAVERAGVPAADCVAVEDSVRGLRSAKAAGLECWVIPNRLTADAEFGLADRVLTDVRQVRAILQGRNGA